jgi:hypothetical protein
MTLDVSRNEMELREWTGRRKKDETVVARFRVEPAAVITVEGPVLKVSELSMTLESPGVAAEIAELIKHPPMDQGAARLLSEAEFSVKGFLEARAQAMSLLSLMRSDPASALLSAEAMWSPDDPKDPVAAIYSRYSTQLAESLQKTTSFLTSIEPNLGPVVVDRFYALTYTIGVVQDALFEGSPDLGLELAALQELGISTTAQDLAGERLPERLMLQAHPALEALALGRIPPT